MSGRLSAVEADTTIQTLRRQWQRLHRWAGQLDDVATARPSVLSGWTVADLIAHLGRAMDALAVARPAEPGTVPITLAEYLGGYPDRAEQISEVTHDLAARISHDPLGEVEAMAQAALDRLDELRRLGDDPVVQARRAPILLSEMVTSRLIELVVHGDDLARSVRLPGPGPLDPQAVTLVGEALLEVLLVRGGWDLEVVDELAWIRLACGRVPLTGASLAAALQPRSTADSLPDLGSRLPLL
jgi:uncharacterized protein (TIGR03083 family)